MMVFYSVATANRATPRHTLRWGLGSGRASPATQTHYYINHMNGRIIDHADPR